MPSATYVVIKGRFVIASLVALVLIIGLAPPGRTSYVRPGVNKMVTVNSDGTQAAHPSQWNVRNNPCGFWTASDISANAQHVAFVSLASNLDSNDINGICDVFVHERKTGTTERVSVASDGTPALGIPDKDFSGHPSISANGRYVAFTSSAPNLVAGDVNLAADVFVHDRKTGTTERISVASDDAQPIINLPGLTSESHLPSISANGRHVAFSSKAALVAEDVNGGFDVYVRDRRLQETVLASVPDGTNPSVTDPASGLVNSLVADSFGATQVALSGNGRYVVFSSLGPDYVSGDSNFAADVFVHDLKTKDTERVSVDSSGEQSEAVFESNTRGFVSQTISDDGRLIAFSSAGETLVPNDTNRQPDGARVMDVFVHDRETGRTERVAVTSAGEQGELTSEFPVISGNGRFVSFVSRAANFVPKQFPSQSKSNPNPHDVYVYDRVTGALEWVPVAATERRSDDCAYFSLPGGISRVGRHVAFWSCVDGIAPNDTGTDWDLFVRDRGLDVSSGLGGKPLPVAAPSDELCVTPEICIPPVCIPPVCIPPGEAVSSSDKTDDVDEILTQQGANLYGASLAYRPQFKDLFAAIELEYMPSLNIGAAGVFSTAGSPPIFYGLRFKVESKSYEVRATSLLGGTFGLFDCADSRACTAKVADLRGGYGTTGMRVVFSLPLREIGLQDGGELSNVEAFSGLGTFQTGATEILDIVRIK